MATPPRWTKTDKSSVSDLQTLKVFFEGAKLLRRDLRWRRQFKPLLREAHRLQKRGAWTGRAELQDCFSAAALHFADSLASVTTTVVSNGRRREVLIVDLRNTFDADAYVDKLHHLAPGGRAMRHLRRYRQLERDMLVRDGREPTTEEATAHLRISQEQFEQLRRLMASWISLNQQCADDDDSTWIDTITEDWQAYESADELFERKEQLQQFEELKTILTPAELAAVEGTARGTSKQAVNQAYHRAVEKMQREAQRRGWWSPIRATAPDREQAERIWFRHRVRQEREALFALIRSHYHDLEQGRPISRFTPSTPEERIEMAAGRDRGLRPWIAVPVVENPPVVGQWLGRGCTPPSNWGRAEPAERPRTAWNREPLRNGKWAAYTGARHELPYIWPGCSSVSSWPATPSAHKAATTCCIGEEDGQHDRACLYRRAS